jgi:hypothetical protein
MFFISGLRLGAQSGLERLFGKAEQYIRWLTLDPKFFLMSRLARIVAVRERMAQAGHYPRTSRHKASKVLVGTGNGGVENIAAVVDTMNTCGYFQGFQLKPDLVRSLLEFAYSTPCYANRKQELPFAIEDRETFAKTLSVPLLKAGYLNYHEDCKAFQDIKQDPYLVDIASQYLGHPAVYLRGELAWDFPGQTSWAEKVQNARVFHCDINDYKTIKFFFYLTAVTSAEGAHIYIKGTHRQRGVYHQWIGQSIASIPDETLVNHYGQDRVQVVTGPAGYGFVGDPYCLHKGTAPDGEQEARLLLQLEYGMTSYKVWYF